MEKVSGDRSRGRVGVLREQEAEQWLQGASAWDSEKSHISHLRFTWSLLSRELAPARSLGLASPWVQGPCPGGWTMAGVSTYFLSL